MLANKYPLFNGGFTFPIPKTNKAMFNSLFLVQYDAHFSAISHIYTQAALFKMLQTTMPDATAYITTDSIESIINSRPNFREQRKWELGEMSMGFPDTESQKLSSVLRLIHRFRYAKYRRSSKHLHIFMDQKFSGSGLV